MTATDLSFPLALLLCAAAAAHLPVIGEHLHEAFYMGVLFIAFTVVALLLAALVTLAPTRLIVIAAAALCLAAVGVYVATRLIAFPQLDDDVGYWSDPWGILAISVEGAAAVFAVWFSARLERDWEGA